MSRWRSQCCILQVGITAQDFVQADMQKYNSYAWGSIDIGSRDSSEIATAYVQVSNVG